VIGLGILVVVLLGLLFAPHLFYDQFIWKYFWGPLKADALGHPVELHGTWAYEGYTIVSEVVYGILLIFSLLGIYKFFKFLKIQVNTPFLLAVFPFILLGPIARVLEDSGLYHPPLIYWFISPLIYVQIALYFFGSFLVSYYLEKSRFSFRKILLLYGGVLLSINLFYLMVYALWPDACSYYISPLILIVFSLFSFLLFICAFYYFKKFTYHIALSSLGILILLPAIYLIGRWLSGFPWMETGESYFSVLPIVLLLAGGTVLGIFALSKKHILPLIPSFINLFLVFGHMLDGWASYIAVKDPFNLGLIYGEKHPLPEFLMEHVHGLSYPLVKLVMVLIVIYLIDTPFKQELEKYVNLGNLLKIAILILGFAPGFRDLLRVIMGI
jgi:uncharacterized membrane protein